MTFEDYIGLPSRDERRSSFEVQLTEVKHQRKFSSVPRQIDVRHLSKGINPSIPIYIRSEKEASRAQMKKHLNILHESQHNNKLLSTEWKKLVPLHKIALFSLCFGIFCMCWCFLWKIKLDTIELERQ